MNRIILLFLISGLLLGCTGTTTETSGQSDVQTPPTSAPDTTAPAANDTSAPGNTANDTVETDPQVPDTAETANDTDPIEPVVNSKEVLILGRSVAYGWMEYLDAEYFCQDEECYTGTMEATYQGYDFIYSEIDIPPDVATSAVERVDLYGDNAGTVFFKLCFDDFESDESMENAARNEDYVKYVYDEVVTKRGKKLIVGNALPRVEEYTDSTLTSNHLAYNSWLDDFASTHDDIQVLDLYGILTTSSGNLNMDYASDEYDSHPNDLAYSKITPKFMELLN